MISKMLDKYKGKKNRGNTIIEAIVSLAILMIVSMMLMTSIIATNKSQISRDMYEEVDRISYSIMNEVKYNYTYIQLSNEMKKYNNVESIGFRYREDILNKLIKSNLFDLEKGNDIVLKIVSSESDNKIVNMKLTVNISTAGGTISSERNFNKAWWMDYK